MLKLIKTDAEYESALERVYELMQMNIEPETDLADELEVLVSLIKSYEEIHFYIAPY